MSLFRRFPSRSKIDISKAENWLCRSCSRRLYSGAIKENDIVLLKHKNNSNGAPVLTPNLRPGRKFELYRDSIPHDEILGKGFREVVTTRKGVSYRIHQPTLGDYTSLSPRIVTPIYPQDANLIVSLLDLHPSVPGVDDEKLEIFEAGTGHGALTLHLARAVHGANTAAPAIPSSSVEQPSPSEEDQSVIEADKAVAYNAWRANRRAVIHTLDSSARHSKHAEVVVENFRNGVYYPHVDFHVGSIEEYLSSRLTESNNEPFLGRAILDLPSTHLYMDIVGQALKSNGTLITFSPSITQVNVCVMHTKDKKLPFFLENVLELGAGIGAGGREWDVRPVKPRAILKAEAEAKLPTEEGEVSGDTLEEIPVPGAPVAPDSGWEMVCRPKVGVRTAGGGFVGVWRRTVNY